MSISKLKLEPIARVSGEVQIPGSKSLSNRILLIAALANGRTTISNLLDGDDVTYMLNALGKLGVQTELSQDRQTCVVHGRGGPFSEVAGELFLGNAGTAMRPLTAVLCAGHGEYTLTGEPRMFERPIADLVDALSQMGGAIEYLATPGYPPLKIISNGINGGNVTIDGSVSSQYLTALLIASPLAEQDVIIQIQGDLVSKPYIDITLHVMQSFGVQVKNINYQEFRVERGQHYQSPGEIMVEGDASSASYFLAAGAIAGGKVRVNGVGSNSVQGDRLFGEVLAAMGAQISYGANYIEAEPGATLSAIDMDLNHIPDAAMTIATTALFAKGTTTIRNIENWRVKETDRLSAMATELIRLGATVDEGKDYLTITPPDHLPHVAIDTYNDHRIAMCFSLVALGGTPVTINDPECINKTFPTYFELFDSIRCPQV